MSDNTPLLEILSPVGDMERLYAALDFGADAVYLGGTMFGMRAQSAKFDSESLKTAVEEAYKIYLEEIRKVLLEMEEEIDDVE